MKRLQAVRVAKVKVRRDIPAHRLVAAARAVVEAKRTARRWGRSQKKAAGRR